MSGTWTVPAEAVVPTRPDFAPAPGERIRRHWRGCFGCRPVDDGGLGLVALAGEGLSVTATMPVAHVYEGGPGVVHGGLLATALDETMGFVTKMLSQMVVTAHLEVDYARPITLGSTMHLRARIDGVVRQKIYMSAEALLDDDPAPVGTAKALFIEIDGEQHFAELAANSERVPQN